MDIKRKSIWSLLTLMVTAMVSLSLFSCGDDDDDDDNLGSGLKGWYTELDKVAKESDFDIINEAIDNGELLSSYHYGGETHNHIASYSEFINSDGLYNDWNASFGRLRFTISSSIQAIRIVDDTTLLYYSAMLYVDGRGEGDAIYKLYAGRIFGDMAYYGDPTYYTYAKVDNKIIVSNGDIYTIVDGGLIKDGSSSKWSKYDPTKRH